MRPLPAHNAYGVAAAYFRASGETVDHDFEPWHRGHPRLRLTVYDIADRLRSLRPTRRPLTRASGRSGPFEMWVEARGTSVPDDGPPPFDAARPEWHPQAEVSRAAALRRAGAALGLGVRHAVYGGVELPSSSTRLLDGSGTGPSMVLEHEGPLRPSRREGVTPGASVSFMVPLLRRVAVQLQDGDQNRTLPDSFWPCCDGSWRDASLLRGPSNAFVP